MAVEFPVDIIMNDVSLDAEAEIYTPEITTDDYSALANKPSINGVVLIGNKSSHDLHLADLDDIYNFYPTDTASGAIASFTDGAEDVPVKSLSVTIEPVQDLHGYESPWVGGAGDQKFNPANWEYTTSQRFWGTNSNAMLAVLNSLPAGTYTITAKIKWDTLDASTANRVYGIYCTGVTVDGRTTISKPSAGTITNFSKTFTISAAQVGTWTKIYWYASQADVLDDRATIYDVGINVGSVTTYIPWENICPISGHSSAVVIRTGSNILDLARTGGLSNATVVDANTGTVKSNINSSYYCSAWVNPAFLPSLLKAQPISITASVDDKHGRNLSIVAYGSRTNGSTYKEVSASSGSNSVTCLLDDFTSFQHIDIRFNRGSTTVTDTTTVFTGLRVNIGDTPVDFAPFSAQAVTIDLDGTRYGGQLDVTNGALTVTHKATDITNVSGWVKSTAYRGSFYLACGNANFTFKTFTPFLSSHAVAVTAVGNYQFGKCFCDNSVNLWLLTDPDATVDDFTAYLQAQSQAGTPVWVCGELATPLTVQLTPAELTTLLGDNNIFCSTGGTEVTYRADMGLFIRKVIGGG